MKGLKIAALVTAAAALLAAPTIGQAHQTGTEHTHGKAKGKGKSCAKKPTVNKGFVVRGTLDQGAGAYVADDPASSSNDAVVRIDVLGANKHARNAGVDKGETYTADGTPGNPPGNDPFTVQLSEFSGTDTPSAGDKVRIIGKVEVTRKKCASSGATLASRYGDVNIRKVKIIDQDPDTP